MAKLRDRIEASRDKVCPFLVAAALATQQAVENNVDCLTTSCRIWDPNREVCGLRNK